MSNSNIDKAFSPTKEKLQRRPRINRNTTKGLSRTTSKNYSRPISLTRYAREQRNLDVKTVAKKLDCSEAYVRHAENGNGISWIMAQRLSEIYQCNMMLFLRTNEVKATRRLRRRASREKT